MNDYCQRHLNPRVTSWLAELVAHFGRDIAVAARTIGQPFIDNKALREAYLTLGRTVLVENQYPVSFNGHWCPRVQTFTVTMRYVVTANERHGFDPDFEPEGPAGPFLNDEERSALEEQQPRGGQ